MDNNQLNAFQTAATAIAFCVVVVSIITWFIYIVSGYREETQLKHEHCMVETTNHLDGSSKVRRYCGEGNKNASQNK